MKDIEILNQLLNGNHLSMNELERGLKLIHLLKIEINSRVKE